MPDRDRVPREVTRYRPDIGEDALAVIAYMKPIGDGAWVRFADYMALVRDAAAPSVDDGEGSCSYCREASRERDRYFNQAAEAQDQAARYREALEAIERTDKTPAYGYHGKAAENREGRPPGSGRWLTPREIARAALASSTGEDRA